MISPSSADSTSRFVSWASKPPSPVSCQPALSGSADQLRDQLLVDRVQARSRGLRPRHPRARPDQRAARPSHRPSGATSLIGVTPLFLQSRHGCSFHLRQIRATDGERDPELARPSAAPTSASRPDARRSALVGQRRHHHRDLIDLRRPPAARMVLQRRRSRLVVAAAPADHGRPRVPVRRAISALASPSAASNTIRARAANPARTKLDRVNASSRDRSPSRRTNGAATDMDHCPAPATVDRVTTRNTSRLRLRTRTCDLENVRVVSGRSDQWRRVPLSCVDVSGRCRLAAACRHPIRGVSAGADLARLGPAGSSVDSG